MAEILEAAMLIAFGAAWPASILKSLKSKSAKGKSVLFLFIILVGYSCGIMSKFYLRPVNYVVIFYMLNWSLVFIDMLLYFRNSKLDRLACK